VSAPRAALCDYGMGNIHSAAKALERVGFRVRLASRPDEVAGDLCVLPGVGHFQRCREALWEADLAGPVAEWVSAGGPFLGICVGAQLLFEESDEAPGVGGLGLVGGRVKSLAGRRIPHIGWSEAVPGPAGGDLFASVERFYFVHSFGLEPADPSQVGATCAEGGGFCAALVDGPLVATQFHPEKSGASGLGLLSRLRDRL
jgi:imidazole glycerol-phosphate synthase subunit HisH